MFGELFKKLTDSVGDMLDKSGIDTQLIWDKIKSGAHTAGRETTKMGLELYYVLKAKDTPMMDKAIIGGALAYQFLPNDLISSKDHGVLGAVDNVIALGVAYTRMKKYVTPEIQATVKKQLDEWFGPENPKQGEQASPQIAPIEQPETIEEP